jgi:ATP-dependent Clp protease ATP-binding subunit ClpC
LGDQGYDPDMGARPLRRVIQQTIEDKLSDAMLSHEFEDGETILLELDENNQVVLKHKTAEPEQEPEPAG